MSRRRKKHDSYRARGRRFRSRKNSGWGMNLYRNSREGKIAGVAAGMADHFDIAHWVMRLIWVGAFIFTGTLAVWAYVGAWILLAPRSHRRADDYSDTFTDESAYSDENAEMEYDEYRHDYRPKKVFRYTDSSSERLKRARDRMDAALRRVEAMESYVTSRQFTLNKEFSKL